MKRPKIMFSENDFFYEKFSESQRAMGLKIFVKKVKNCFFLKRPKIIFKKKNNFFSRFFVIFLSAFSLSVQIVIQEG